VCVSTHRCFIPDGAEAAEPEAALAALREPPQRAAGDDAGPLYPEAARRRAPRPEHGTCRVLLCTRWLSLNRGQHISGH